MTQSKEALKLSKAEAAARRAIATMIRLRFGNPAKVARAWAREWVESIIEAPDEWPLAEDEGSDEPIDEGDPIYGDGEHQISFDSAMFRD